jgi:hypothetical protein
MATEERTTAYAGLTAGPQEITYIRQFRNRFSGLSRKVTIATLCEHLEWLSAGGEPRLEAANELLSRLEATGEIDLPTLQRSKSHRGPRSKASSAKNPLATDSEPLRSSLKCLPSIRLHWAGTPEQEAQCNADLKAHHPLGYAKPFGYWGRYAILSGKQRLGCLLLGGAARALAKRDEWIGWPAQQRRSNLHQVINNSRFLIFPWVEVPHLASHVLGRLARVVANDWERQWGFRPVLMETFVDPAHYSGTCYRAAGWEALGMTTGLGLARPGKTYRSSPKRIFAKPLQPDFRRLLCATPSKSSRSLMP